MLGGCTRKLLTQRRKAQIENMKDTFDKTADLCVCNLIGSNSEPRIVKDGEGAIICSCMSRCSKNSNVHTIT